MYILLITTNYQNSVSSKIQEMMNLRLKYFLSLWSRDQASIAYQTTGNMQDSLLYAGGSHTQNPAGRGLWRCGSSTDYISHVSEQRTTHIAKLGSKNMKLSQT